MNITVWAIVCLLFDFQHQMSDKHFKIILSCEKEQETEQKKHQQHFFMNIIMPYLLLKIIGLGLGLEPSQKIILSYK